MPQTEQERDAMNRSIDAAIAGLGNTSSDDQQHRSNPRPPAASPEERMSQLPIDEPQREQMRDAISRVSNGGGK